MFAASFVLFGLMVEPPLTIARGLLSIIREPDILITDYIELGGIGAAFVNSGLLMLLSILLLKLLKVEMGGLSIAAVFLMGSFALFGKNIFNVWITVLGVLIYTRLKGLKFKDYVHIALFGTSMAPVVTEFFFVIDLPLWARVPLGIIIGLSIGFFLPPISAHLLKTHMGYNLYNVGFTVGIMGTLYVSIFKSYGYVYEPRLLWSSGNDNLLGAFLLFLFAAMLAAGFVLKSCPACGLKRLFCHEGTLGCDIVALEGFGPALINMALNGLVSMSYVLLVGGPLNGPTIGGILTVVGFGAYGKHCRNILPVLAGVLIGGFTKIWSINDPPILLAALFGTSLAPIAGHYGWIWGVVAGFINSSVVLNSGILHGGMNLYNTGFSAGIVAAVMVPILEAHRKKAGGRI